MEVRDAVLILQVNMQNGLLNHGESPFASNIERETLEQRRPSTGRDNTPLRATDTSAPTSPRLSTNSMSGTTLPDTRHSSCQQRLSNARKTLAAVPKISNNISPIFSKRAPTLRRRSKEKEELVVLSDKTQIGGWLRERAKTERDNKRLWRNVAERFDKLPSTLPHDGAALWLYHTLVTFQTHYSGIHDWNAQRFSENLHNLALKLDEVAPSIKQLGLTGAQFLSLHASDLSNSFQLSPEVLKEVLFLIEKIKAGGGGGKGGLVPCETQISTLLGQHAVAKAESDSNEIRGQHKLDVLSGVIHGALERLPRISAVQANRSVVFKYCKLPHIMVATTSCLRRDPSATAALIDDKFPIGATLRLPYFTSCAADLDLLQYLSHYQKCVGNSHLSEGTNLIVRYVPASAAANPMAKRGGAQSALRVYHLRAPEGETHEATPDTDKASSTGHLTHRATTKLEAADGFEGVVVCIEPFEDEVSNVIDVGVSKYSSQKQAKIEEGERLQMLEERRLLPFQAESKNINNGTATMTQKLQALGGAENTLSEIIVPADTPFRVTFSCFLPCVGNALCIAVEQPGAQPTTFTPLSDLAKAFISIENIISTQLKCNSTEEARRIPTKVLQNCKNGVFTANQIIKDEARSFLLIGELEARLLQRYEMSQWVLSWMTFSAGFALLESHEEMGKVMIEQEYADLWALFVQYKQIICMKRLSEAKASWLMMQLENPVVAEITACAIALSSHKKAKCVALTTCAHADAPHHQLMKKRGKKHLVFYIFLLYLHAAFHLPRHCEFLQQFSLPDATTVTHLHVQDEAVTLAYISLWNSLGSVSPSSPIEFSHSLLEAFLRAHRGPTITLQVLTAVAKVAAAIKAGLIQQQPSMQSWVVRRALEHVGERQILKRAVAITCVMAEAPSLLTKNFVYQQGSGKLVLVVVDAVGWNDVVLLRQALGALVRMLSSLEVSWRAGVVEEGRSIVHRVVEEGTQLWETAMRRSKQKKEWVKARSLASRAEWLLNRV